jgi:hypothetical protein
MSPEERKAPVAKATEIDRLQDEHEDLTMIMELAIRNNIYITAENAKLAWNHPCLKKEKRWLSLRLSKNYEQKRKRKAQLASTTRKPREW